MAKSNKSLSEKIKHFFLNTNFYKKILFWYLIAVLFGAILLITPIALKKGVNAYTDPERPYNFIDALFTSISAFSDTGLSTVDINETYTLFGQFVILFLIQIGGLGLFVLYWTLWNIIFNNFISKSYFKKKYGKTIKYGFSNSMLLSAERGSTKLGLSNKTIKISLLVIVLIEIIFSFIYAGIFYNSNSYAMMSITTGINNNGMFTSSDFDFLSKLYIQDLTKPLELNKNFGYAFYAGLFHSVSTINNAGFSLFGNQSLATFRNDFSSIVLIFTIIQFIIGGIGYPLIYDIYEWFISKVHHERFRFSLFTKISLSSYFIVLLFGVFLFFGFEYGISDSFLNKIDELRALENIDPIIKERLTNYWGNNIEWNRIINLFFMSTTTRSAGFSSVNIELLDDPSKWLFIILMFIGASPSSTGGGIRTTTLAVLIMSLICRLRGMKNTRIFKRTIPNQTVINAFMCSCFAFGLIVVFVFIGLPTLSTLPGFNFDATDVFFELSSAFGTVGLSSGITSILANTSAQTIVFMLFLCILMIIGQLGLSSTIFLWRKNITKYDAYDYPFEDVKIC